MPLPLAVQYCNQANVRTSLIIGELTERLSNGLIAPAWPQICIKYQMPYLLFTPYHLM